MWKSWVLALQQMVVVTSPRLAVRRRGWQGWDCVGSTSSCVIRWCLVGLWIHQSRWPPPAASLPNRCCRWAGWWWCHRHRRRLHRRSGRPRFGRCAPVRNSSWSPRRWTCRAGSIPGAASWSVASGCRRRAASGCGRGSSRAADRTRCPDCRAATASWPSASSARICCCCAGDAPRRCWCWSAAYCCAARTSSAPRTGSVGSNICDKKKVLLSYSYLGEVKLKFTKKNTIWLVKLLNFDLKLPSFWELGH